MNNVKLSKLTPQNKQSQTQIKKFVNSTADMHVKESVMSYPCLKACQELNSASLYE